MTNNELIALRNELQARVFRTNVQRYPEGYGSPYYDGPVINPAWRYAVDERPLVLRGVTRAQFDQMLSDAGLDPVTVPAGEGDVLSDEALAAASAPSRAAVDAEVDRRISAGFMFNGVHFQSDAKARERISTAYGNALSAVLAGAQAGDLRWHGEAVDFFWIATDNSKVTMDAQTVLAFQATLGKHVGLHVAAGAALKDTDPTPADFADDAYWPA